MGFQVTLRELWVLRKANGIRKNIVRLLALPFHVLRAMRELRSYTLVYINTSVIFDYALASRFSSCASILHIHEIPTGLAMHLIKTIIHATTAVLVYNSAATKRAFGLSDDRRQFVLHNGIPDQSPTASRQPFSDDASKACLLLIGRINDWKGQDLLVDAVAALPAAHRAI